MSASTKMAVVATSVSTMNLGITAHAQTLWFSPMTNVTVEVCDM